MGRPQAAFQRRSNVTASTVSLSDKPVQSLQGDHTGHHLAPEHSGRPRREGNRSANISFRKQLTAMGRQEVQNMLSELQQMPGNRLRIQQLTLIISTSPAVPPIIPKTPGQPSPATRD